MNDRTTIRYAVYGDEDTIPQPLGQLRDLGARGKLERSAALMEGRSPSWVRISVLADELLEAGHRWQPEHEGWYLVAGETAALGGVEGWLEYGDWVVLACPPDYRSEHEIDILVVPREEFEAAFLPTVRACVPLTDDAGMRLNAAQKEVARLEGLLEDGGEAA